MSNLTNIPVGELDKMLENILVQMDISSPEEVVRLMNAGELTVTLKKPKWIEKDGIIYFSVTSDGTTGEKWVSRLRDQGFSMGNYAEEVLYSQHFKPTNRVTYNMAILKSELFKEEDRITKKIILEARRRGLHIPNCELACLIREKFSAMDLRCMDINYLFTAHNPIEDISRDPLFLRVRSYDGESYLDTCNAEIYYFFKNHYFKWRNNVGFAFIVFEEKV